MLDKSKSLDSQINNGDIIYISRVFLFTIKWKNIRQKVRCNTNLSFYTLRNIICETYSIPKSDWDRYKLKARGHTISLEDLIPFRGVSDEIEVIEIQGRYLRVKSNVIGNECQSSNLDVHIGIEMEFD